MALCKNVGGKWAALLPADTKYRVCSGCVLCRPGWCYGEVFKGVGHKFMALAPWPGKGPAHKVRQKLFLALVRTDCMRGPILARKQINSMLTFQSMCAPIWGWILFLNVKVAMSDFWWGTLFRLCSTKLIPHYLYTDKVIFPWYQLKYWFSFCVSLFLSTGLYPFHQKHMKPGVGSWVELFCPSVLFAFVCMCV